MMVKLYQENPNEKVLLEIAEVLRNDGLIIYPTDGVYAFGCSINSSKALERLKQIKGKKESEFTIMCSSISEISDFAKFSTPTFKMLKRNLPGKFTFVMKASSKIPSKILGKRETIGVRLADNPIPRAIVEAYGEPIITSSVKDQDKVVEYTTDPELIKERWESQVDLIVDGGYGEVTPTTLIDLSEGEINVLREGGGELIL